MNKLRRTISRFIFSTLLTAVILATVPTASAQVASTSCQLSGIGFFGQFYNMDNTDDGMNAAQQKSVDPNVARDTSWFLQSNYVFDRIDPALNFGANFYPIQNTTKPGDPFNFSVHWRAVMNVPTTATYSFVLTNDDDAWVFIDNTVAIEQAGSLPLNTRAKQKSLPLNAGKHQIDVYYVERSPTGAIFTLTADTRLSFVPLPPGCSLTGSITTGTPTVAGATAPCNCPCTTGTTGTSTTPGQLLGTSTTRYTPAIALYKTANSPAIYAIYANGERHYISSPTTFELYGYSYNNVKVVSQETLDRYPEARLLRTPENATVWHIFSRPNRQWLKINIPTPTVFVSYPKNEWGNVIVVDALDLASYPNANLVRVSGSSDTYLIEDGKRRLFVSPETLEELGYNPAEVVDISHVHLNAFPPDEPIG